MKVLIHSQKLNKAGKIENFTGATLQDLLNATTSNGINVSDLYNSEEVEVVVNPGNIVLRGVDSSLPQEDIKVFFTIKKNKAGIEPQDINKLSQEIKEAIKSAQRQSSSEQKQVLKQQLQSTINNFFNLNKDEELDALMEEAKNL